MRIRGQGWIGVVVATAIGLGPAAAAVARGPAPTDVPSPDGEAVTSPDAAGPDPMAPPPADDASTPTDLDPTAEPGGPDPEPAAEPAPEPEPEPMEKGTYGDPRAEPAPGRPRVHLRIDGRGDVRLYRVHATLAGRSGTRLEATDEEICAAPCDEVVDGSAGEQFVIGGRGISRSLPFSLIDADPDTTITVRPGRRGLRVAGWILAGIGASAVLGGAVALTLADDDETQRRGAGYTFIAGLPLVAAGGIMIAFGYTRFRIGDPPRKRDRRGRRIDGR